MSKKGLPGFNIFLAGMRSTLGRKSFKGSRHRKAQMKAISKGRFTGRNSNFGL